MVEPSELDRGTHSRGLPPEDPARVLARRQKNNGWSIPGLGEGARLGLGLPKAARPPGWAWDGRPGWAWDVSGLGALSGLVVGSGVDLGVDLGVGLDEGSSVGLGRRSLSTPREIPPKREGTTTCGVTVKKVHVQCCGG